MKHILSAVVIVGLSAPLAHAGPPKKSAETDLAEGFSTALAAARHGSARHKSVAAAARAAQESPFPTTFEDVSLKKDRMMELLTSQPYKVRGRHEQAYGVITHWAWQDYVAKHNEFLQRRRDFAREVVAYARTRRPDPRIMDVIHWARSARFAVMNHPEGRDYKDNTISPFLKDEEFSLLPADFQK